MAETRIKESLRYRKVGGGFLFGLGVILTLFTARFVLPYFSSGRDLIILLLGPSTLALGLWAAFLRRAAALRMVITDNTVQIKSLSGDVAVIQLSDLQSIAIARPLILDPPILIADEPTGNLDRATGEKVLEILLDEQKERGVSLLLVTHDERLAKRCERVVYMEDGLIQADTSAPMPT